MQFILALKGAALVGKVMNKPALICCDLTVTFHHFCRLTLLSTFYTEICSLTNPGRVEG